MRHMVGGSGLCVVDSEEAIMFFGIEMETFCCAPATIYPGARHPLARSIPMRALGWADGWGFNGLWMGGWVAKHVGRLWREMKHGGVVRDWLLGWWVGEGVQGDASVGTSKVEFQIARRSSY